MTLKDFVTWIAIASLAVALLEVSRDATFARREVERRAEIERAARTGAVYLNCLGIGDGTCATTSP